MQGTKRLHFLSRLADGRDHPTESQVTAEKKDKSVESANGCVLSLYSGSRKEKLFLFLRTEQEIETHIVYHM